MIQEDQFEKISLQKLKRMSASPGWNFVGISRKNSENGKHYVDFHWQAIGGRKRCGWKRCAEMFKTKFAKISDMICRICQKKVGKYTDV